MSGYCTGGAASQWPHWKSGRLHTRNKVRIYVQTTGRRKLYVHAGDRNNTRIRNGHLFLEKTMKTQTGDVSCCCFGLAVLLLGLSVLTSYSVRGVGCSRPEPWSRLHCSE